MEKKLVKIKGFEKILIYFLVFCLFTQMWAWNIGPIGLNISTIILLLIFIYIRGCDGFDKIHKFSFFILMFILFNILISYYFISTDNYRLVLIKGLKITISILVILISTLLFSNKLRFQCLNKAIIIFSYPFSLYGIYQYIAIKNDYPYFMNVFQNDRDHNIKGMFDYFGGGWNGDFRIYGVFSEPSFYAVFLSFLILFLIIANKDKILSINNIIVMILLLTNLYLSSSRTAYLLLVVTIIFMVILNNNFIKFYIDRNKVIFKYLFLIFIVLSPMLVYQIQQHSNENVFNDISSSTRSSSQSYYFNNYIQNYNYFFGEGLGTIGDPTFPKELKSKFVDNIAYSGYIQMLYEGGLFGLFYLTILPIILYLRYFNNYMMVINLMYFMSLGLSEYYLIDSVVTLYGILLGVGVFLERNEKKQKSFQYSFNRGALVNSIK